MSDLIARVEAATGPDRELDARVEAATSPWPADCLLEFFAGSDAFAVHRGTSRALDAARDHYTASLDAVLALAERLRIDVELLMQDATSDTYLWVKHVERYQQRLVFAILAALLREIQAQPNRHNARDGSSRQYSNATDQHQT